MSVLLRRYIRSIILEIEGNAHVPNQMPGTKKPGDSDKDEDEGEELGEFSGAGAIAGFAAPLGYTGKDAEGPGAKGERDKRKKPGWH
jgi:hypothetical protein